MDRYNFFYRQKVMEDELDNAFAECENADRALSLDLDYISRTPPEEKGTYGGVMWGFGASNPSSLDISIASGAAYDESSQRIYTSQAYTVTVTNEGDVESAGSTVIGAGGTPAGASTDPGTGNSVWVSVYIAFARKDTQERFDGYNTAIWFQNAESFYFHVVKGTVKATGSLLVTDKPARLSNKVLLTDIKIKNDGGTVSVDGDPDDTRTEWYLNLATTTGLETAISQKGNVRDALWSLLTLYNDHASGLDDKHKAAQVIFDTGSLGTTWADTNAGTYGGSTTVMAALTNLATDLKATATDDSGAIRLGAKAQSGSLGELTSASPANLAAGPLEAQLTELLTAVNSRIFRGGDETIAGALVPKTTGIALGEDGGNNWDVYARDLKMFGWVKSNFAPDTTDTYTLGTASKLWQQIYCTTMSTVAINTTGVSTFGGNTIFNGSSNVFNTPLTAGSTALFNDEIQTEDIIPQTTAAHSLGSNPTAAGKEWNQIFTQYLYASEAIQVNSGIFRYYPSTDGVFAIYTDDAGLNTAFQMDESKISSNEAPLFLGTATAIDATSTPPSDGGVHTLRVNPTELGLTTRTPKMPLAFGSDAAPTGGMNRYGIPIRNWHFRDDFMYHPDNFTPEMLDGTTQTNMHYTLEGTTPNVHILPSKGLHLSCVSGQSAVLYSGARLELASGDIIMHGQVELNSTEQVKVVVGLKSASGPVGMWMTYNAAGSASTWGYEFQTGVGGLTGTLTDMTPANGVIYFTMRQVTTTTWQIVARNGAAVATAEYTGAGSSVAVGPYISVSDNAAAAKYVYLYFWECYRQAQPFY